MGGPPVPEQVLAAARRHLDGAPPVQGCRWVVSPGELTKQKGRERFDGEKRELATLSLQVSGRSFFRIENRGWLLGTKFEPLCSLQQRNPRFHERSELDARPDYW